MERSIIERSIIEHNRTFVYRMVCLFVCLNIIVDKNKSYDTCLKYHRSPVSILHHRKPVKLIKVDAVRAKSNRIRFDCVRFVRPVRKSNSHNTRRSTLFDLRTRSNTNCSIRARSVFCSILLDQIPRAICLKVK